MEHECSRLICQLSHHFLDVCGGDSRKFLDSTVDEKAFEAPNTLPHQSLELPCIAWNYASVKADVNPTLALCSVDLLLESGYSSRGRNGIQWHVHHRRHSTKSRSLCASIEALPFCSSWLIEVDVSIDEPR